MLLKVDESLWALHQHGEHVRRQHIDRQHSGVTVVGHDVLVFEVHTCVVDDRVELPV